MYSVQEDIYEAFCQDRSKMEQELVHVPCGHTACWACWRACLTDEINNGNVTDLVCPMCKVMRTEL